MSGDVSDDPNAFERLHAETVTQSLRTSISSSTGFCPQFHIGPIQGAFDSAFGRSLVKKCRPLLIYIHHNDRMSDLFCSEILVKFLNENCIVWPWDISDASNRQRLMKTWKEYFPEALFIPLSRGRCPMLIGISREFALDKNSFTKYRIELLLQGDFVFWSTKQVDWKALLFKLMAFKQECDKNERYLSCDFVQKLAACRELALEIAEYMSFNDAISTFSMGILPLLWQCNRKLPSKGFIL